MAAREPAVLPGVTRDWAASLGEEVEEEMVKTMIKTMSKTIVQCVHL